MTITLTLNDIKNHGPCKKGWEKLLKHLDKTKADDEPFPLLTVLDSNGLDDALWCFCALGKEYDSWARLTICDLVQPAMQYATDPRPQMALDVARDYANGDASKADLEAAAEAAEAAEAATYAAADAVADAAWAAADAADAAEAADAAAEAARIAAWDAAKAADAAEAADAAWAAARREQESILRAAITKAREIKV